jgi:hypothetical protein
MLEYARQLHEELSAELEGLTGTPSTNLNAPDERLTLVSTAIYRIKEKLKTYQFKDQKEEIEFNKFILPMFLSLDIYYTEKFDLECVELIGTEKSKYKFYRKTFKKIDDFFRRHIEFFKYYRSGRTDLDKDFFLRKSAWNGNTIDLFTHVIDPTFCTIYSLRVAMILAYTRLERDIQDNNSGDKFDPAQPKYESGKLRWTDAKQGLIELIYALKEKGAFNDGKADLYKITGYFEEVFSIKLGNISSNFQKVLSRKTGYTNYIDKLKDKLLGRIDYIEDRHIK